MTTISVLILILFTISGWDNTVFARVVRRTRTVANLDWRRPELMIASKSVWNGILEWSIKRRWPPSRQHFIYSLCFDLPKREEKPLLCVVSGGWNQEEATVSPVIPRPAHSTFLCVSNDTVYCTTQFRRTRLWWRHGLPLYLHRPVLCSGCEMIVSSNRITAAQLRCETSAVRISTLKPDYKCLGHWSVIS